MRVAEILGVSKVFGEKVAVKDISFSVSERECVGVIGLNGAGKTTLVSMVVGLLSPTAGSVKVFGKSPRSPEVRGKIGYLPELFAPPPRLTPFELVRLFCGVLDVGRCRAEHLLELVGIMDVKDKLISKLSKGMKQRLGIALVLVADPSFVVLDEPFTGLDPLGRYEMKEMIRELKNRGKTIIFSSHILQDVDELADRIIVMDRGNVVYNGLIGDFVSTLSAESLEDAFLKSVKGEV